MPITIRVSFQYACDKYKYVKNLKADPFTQNNPQIPVFPIQQIQRIWQINQASV